MPEPVPIHAPRKPKPDLDTLIARSKQRAEELRHTAPADSESMRRAVGVALNEVPENHERFRK